MTPPLLPRRHALAAAAAGLTSLALAGCGDASRSMTSDQASSSSPLTLSLANSLDPEHVTTKALKAFATDVEERSEGRLRISMFDSGQLGSEPQVLAQMRQGIVDLTRVSAPGLAAWNPGYHAFGLPYVFDSEEHYYAALDSAPMQQFFTSHEEAGLLGLTYFSSGARSFYTASTPVRTPQDAAGLKIRVQDMRTQVQMMSAFGASPVVMPLGDAYTALQTGLIDGAESNETVLDQTGHGEVAKVFSLTEHTRIPDLLVIGAPAWKRLTPADRSILTESAQAATQKHKKAWAESIETSYAAATDMGVEFIKDIDRDAFREASRSVVETFAADYPEVADLLSIIENARG